MQPLSLHFYFSVSVWACLRLSLSWSVFGPCIQWLILCFCICLSLSVFVFVRLCVGLSLWAVHLVIVSWDKISGTAAALQTLPVAVVPPPTRPPTLSALSNAQGFHLRPAFPLPLIMMEARLTISKKDGQWQLSFRSSMKSKLNGRTPSTSTTQRPETSNQALHTFHLGLFNPPPKMDLIFCFKSKSWWEALYEAIEIFASAHHCISVKMTCAIVQTCKLIKVEGKGKAVQLPPTLPPQLSSSATYFSSSHILANPPLPPHSSNTSPSSRAWKFWPAVTDLEFPRSTTRMPLDSAWYQTHALNITQHQGASHEDGHLIELDLQAGGPCPDDHRWLHDEEARIITQSRGAAGPCRCWTAITDYWLEGGADTPDFHRKLKLFPLVWEDQAHVNRGTVMEMIGFICLAWLLPFVYQSLFPSSVCVRINQRQKRGIASHNVIYSKRKIYRVEKCRLTLLMTFFRSGKKICSSVKNQMLLTNQFC